MDRTKNVLLLPDLEARLSFHSENLEASANSGLSYHSHKYSTSTTSEDNRSDKNILQDFEDIRADYRDAVDCLGYCESIINALQEKLAMREEHLVGLEERMVEMSLELAKAKAFEDEHRHALSRRNSVENNTDDDGGFDGACIDESVNVDVGNMEPRRRGRAQGRRATLSGSIASSGVISTSCTVPAVEPRLDAAERKRLANSGGFSSAPNTPTAGYVPKHTGKAVRRKSWWGASNGSDDTQTTTPTELDDSMISAKTDGTCSSANYASALDESAFEYESASSRNTNFNIGQLLFGRRRSDGGSSSSPNLQNQAEKSSGPSYNPKVNSGYTITHSRLDAQVTSGSDGGGGTNTRRRRAPNRARLARQQAGSSRSFLEANGVVFPSSFEDVVEKGCSDLKNSLKRSVTALKVDIDQFGLLADGDDTVEW